MNTTGTTSMPGGTFSCPARSGTVILPTMRGARSAVFHSMSNIRTYSRVTPTSARAVRSAGESANVVRQ